MNSKKLTIPAILATTVLVAGIFALMPIQEAGTVHTAIQATLVGKVAEAGPDIATVAGETFTLTCTADYTILGLTLDMGAGTYGGTDDFDITIGGDRVATEPVAGTVAIPVPLLANGFGGAEGGLAAENLIITARAGDFGDANEDILKARATYLSTGTCTWAGFE